MNFRKIAHKVAWLVLCGPLVANAANITSDKWTFVGTYAKVNKVFIIEKSVFTRGELRKIDVQLELAEPRSHTPHLGSDKTPKLAKTFHWVAWFDCKKNLMQIDSLTVYGTDDKWLDYNRPDIAQDFAPVTETSIAYAAMKAGCALELKPKQV